MTTSFALGLAAALGAALVYGVGAIVQARAVRGLHADIAALGSFLRTAAGAPLIWLTVGMYLVGFVLHAVSIELLPLYLSQAGIALSLPVTAVCAGWLDQRLTARAWAALLMVVVGIGLMSAGAGQSGAHARPETWFTVTVAVAALVLAVVALLGLVTSPGWLGAFAGLAYAGCALAVRSVATVNSLISPSAIWSRSGSAAGVHTAKPSTRLRVNATSTRLRASPGRARAVRHSPGSTAKSAGSASPYRSRQASVCSAAIASASSAHATRQETSAPPWCSLMRCLRCLVDVC